MFLLFIDFYVFFIKKINFICENAYFLLSLSMKNE